MAVITGNNVMPGVRFRTGVSSGASGDTTGYGPFVTAGTPGTTFMASVAEKGATANDNVTGKLFINTGSKAAPTWTLVGSQS